MQNDFNNLIFLEKKLLKDTGCFYKQYKIFNENNTHIYIYIIYIHTFTILGIK